MLSLVQDLPRRDGRPLPVAPSGLSFDPLTRSRVASAPASEAGLRPVDGVLPGSSSDLSYEDLRETGLKAAEAGELEAALSCFQKCLELARAAQDEKLVDLAVCNRSAVLISLGRWQEVTRELREILMTGRCIENCFLAAYQLSRAHSRDKAPKKGLFYAQIARDRALGFGRDDYLVWAYNQLANCLMDDSRFEEAAAEYRRALGLQPEEPSPWRAVLLVNLGYCLMMLGRMRDGLSLTFRSLRWCRSFGVRVYEIWAHLDLCYAYLDLARYPRARQHGLRALALAEDSGDAHCLKNALYLLGEIARSDQDLEGAFEHFSRLQRTFYPGSPELVDLMLVIGTRQLVNLRA